MAPKSSRRTRRRGRGRKSKTNKQIARVVKQVHHKLDQKKELRLPLNKFLDTATLANSFHIAAPSNIVKGDQDNQREGNAVYLSYIHYVLSLGNNDTKTKRLRVMIVAERSPGSVLQTTTWTNLFVDDSFAIRTATALQEDLTSLINQNVLKVYSDRVYTCKPEGQGSLLVKAKIRVGRKCVYEQGSSGTTAPVNGNVYLVAHLVEQDNATSASTSILGGVLRCFFKDASDYTRKFL